MLRAAALIEAPHNEFPKQSKLPRALRRILFLRKKIYMEKREKEREKGKDRKESVEKFPSYALPS